MREIGKIICDGMDAQIDNSIDMNAAIKDVLPDGSIHGVVGTNNAHLAGIDCGQVVWVNGKKVVIDTITPAPVEPAPVEPAPVDPAPVDPAPVKEPEVRGPAGSTNEDVVVKVNEAKVSTEGGTANHYQGAHGAGGRVTTNSGGNGHLVQGRLADGSRE